MSSASVNNIKLTKTASKPFWDSLARKGIEAVLSGLSRGRLLIEVDGEVMNFGETPSKQAKSVESLLAKIVIHDTSAFRDLLFRGSIGAGESYMRGAWSSPNLLQLIRLMVANMAVVDKMDSSLLGRCSAVVQRLADLNTRAGAKRNISAHYDLGNDFFELILDKHMMYSAAMYPDSGNDLDLASTQKLDTICRKLALQPSDHLLEIGSGWGGMAIFAAKHYGCRVTTTTISREQYDYARTWVEKEGLQNQIHVLFQDYRELQGKYDKLVSVEMIEAVGDEFHKTYFQQCSQLLNDDGLMLIQAITIPDQRYQQYRRSVDFIRKYIFPGGCLPSHGVVARHIGRHTDLQIVDVEDMTAHYAQTLNDWRQRFLARLPEVRAQGYSEAFIRMWEFYLCYCEGGFAERVIGTTQFLMAKPDARFQLSLR